MDYLKKFLLLAIFCFHLQPSLCRFEEIDLTPRIQNMTYDDIMDRVNSMNDDDIEAYAMEHTATFLNGQVNCLGLPKKFFKLFRWMFKPHSKEEVNVKFYLKTRKVRKWMEIPTSPGISMKGLDFNPDRYRTIFIVHGFLSSALSSGWVDDMAEALLDWSDVNVIAVEWTSSWQYWRAVANTKVVGAELTKLGMYLMGVKGADPMSFHLIGHSLGAHIVSYMATCIGGVARITGLDPASPCFGSDDPESKLDSSDASFVDVIHTNGRLFKKLGLGQPDPVGHVDFYPNGGMIQPGCKDKKSILNILKLDKFQRSICSHGRSHQFFIEAIRNNCTFWGHRWKQNEKGYANVDYSSCTLEDCTEMGMLSEEFPARGVFYVTTKERIPFCRPLNMIDQRMARLLGARQRMNFEAGLIT
ncbi:pancreatic lipase-related protein 2-like [Ischnura elegans]|uniref:pancreatic lipase-related protein 2-like n=1 Tax=Ischnura elegans TaxID=197161 RepID=UPI001ED891ED|nr:pancreatic lipase-related protein 2-like [Ischnura elegans]